MKRRLRIGRVIAALVLVVVLAVGVFFTASSLLKKETVTTKSEKVETPIVEAKPKEDVIKKVKLSANGDLLYHIGLIRSAKTNDGYDFSENYTEIKSLISSMDYAIGDYEGSINTEYALNGYPLFNAPPVLPKYIADAGYDMMSLANNHILDSNKEGIISTYNYFKEVGITPIGVTINENDSRVVIKEINGIKVAFVAYTYGFNGMDGLISEKDEYMLHRLDETKIKADLEYAEKNADITVAFPHMGDEYHLEPNQAQIDLYDKMIDWGSDIIFGNHPHVAQPAKMVKKDGADKYIIYSMGNLISNQRLETMDDTMNKKWTERGVIIEANISKKNDEKAKLDSIVYHPTWVRRTPKGSSGGYPTYTYTVLLAEQYLNDQKDLSNDEWERVKATYSEMQEHLKISQ